MQAQLADMTSTNCQRHYDECWRFADAGPADHHCGQVAKTKAVSCNDQIEESGGRGVGGGGPSGVHVSLSRGGVGGGAPPESTSNDHVA